MILPSYYEVEEIVDHRSLSIYRQFYRPSRHLIDALIMTKLVILKGFYVTIICSSTYINIYIYIYILFYLNGCVRGLETDVKN